MDGVLVLEASGCSVAVDEFLQCLASSTFKAVHFIAKKQLLNAVKHKAVGDWPEVNQRQMGKRFLWCSRPVIEADGSVESKISDMDTWSNG